MAKARDLAAIGALAVACMLPFVGKAFHIDDPMYLWAGQQFAADPADFYGFEVNWHGFQEPNYVANKNPPLIGVYLAAVAGVAGWSEGALHAGMVLPLLALLAAVFGIGARMTHSPAIAAILCLAFPVVLVSATTVMSDVLMLSLWCGSTWLWMRGLDEQRTSWLVWAAVGMGLCPLAKYFGLALLPLLAVYALLRTRGLGIWTAVLVIPLAMIGAYEAYLRARYGWSPLADVAQYALTYAPGRLRYGPAERTLVGLSFLGGGALAAAFAAPLLWSRRMLAVWALAAVAAMAASPALGNLGTLELVDEGGARWDLAAQLGLFVTAGVHALALGARDLWRRRDAEAVLLALWLGGTWFFATYTNWSTTARSILPAAVPLALVCVRALESRGPQAQRLIAIPIVAGLAVGLAVARADQILADSARRVATELAPRHDDQRLVFQGAWGLQQYMQEQGYERLRIDGMRLERGDVVLSPETNTNLVRLPRQIVKVREVVDFPAGAGVTTLSRARGAGFYASLWGPLPFAFGPVPPERYTVEELVEPYTLALRPPASARSR